MLTSPQGKLGNDLSGQTFKTNFAALMQSQHFQAAEKVRQRDLLGNLIFNYVSRLVHINFVRKVTGMILDLFENNPADFNLTISDYELFKVKAREAVTLISHQSPISLSATRKPLYLNE